MPTTRCPKCKADLGVQDINVQQGVGVCRSCGGVWKLTEIAQSADDAQADAAAGQEIPPGCWLNDSGAETVLGATVRSHLGCFFAFFASFWSFGVLLLLASVLSGVYSHVVGPLPDWFPIMGGSSGGGGGGGGVGRTPGVMPGGALMILSFMSVPFVLVWILTGSAAMMGLFGRVEVTIRGNDAEIFTGVKRWGWRRKFDAGRVTSVKITESGTTTNGRRNKHIEVAADRLVKLGLVLSEQRRLWLSGALRKILAVEK